MTTSFNSRLGTAPEEATKAPCVASTTANITLSGEQTIDTVAVVAGNRVLVRNQTDASENGIYDVTVGAWTRSTDWNNADDVISGQLVPDANSLIIYQSSFAGIFILGNTEVNFSGSSVIVPDYYGIAGGTVDVITVALNTTITAWTNGFEMRVRASGANTSATPTINPDGIGAKTITKAGNQPLLVGDISSANYEMILRYNSSTDKVELLNPNPDTIQINYLSIAALKLTEGISNQSVIVLSYYTPNFALAYPFDGGGGQFVWDATSTETDDGGLTIKATGVTTGRWIRTYTDEFSVAWFGALGDETTDDTTAIQATLDAVAQIPTLFHILDDYRGNTVTLPPGRFRLTGGLTINGGTTIRGAGSESSILLHEALTGDVLSYTDIDTGTPDNISLQGFSVVQKETFVHTSGYAIKIDGNSKAISLKMKDIQTYGTYSGIYLDFILASTIENVIPSTHVNGFESRFDCTSLNFINCYANNCSGSGYKLAGNYIGLTGCASDSNTLDGYEFYFDNGASTSIVMTNCGTEACLRNGISTDRIGSISIISPRILIGSGGVSAIKIDAGDAITIFSPVISAAAANANPAIDIDNTSGAYPSNVVILGWSGTATNYTTLINNPDYVYWIGSRSDFGADKNGLRIGPQTSFTTALQSLFLGADFRAGSGGTVYGQNNVPVATGAYAGLVASARFKPVVNASGDTIARLISGFFIEAPTITAGTVTRHEGGRIAEMPAGGSADANFVLGDAAVPVGRWSIFNPSTKDNLFYGGIRWGSSTGPIDEFGSGTPEGAVTAPVGSTFRRTDGGAGTSFYVKESGAGNTGWVGK